MRRQMLLGVACSVALVACGPAASSVTGSSSSQPSPTPAASASIAPAPVLATAARGTALAALSLLAIKGRAPLTGYARSRFGPAWADVDHNGCDTRNDILRRDLTAKTMSATCVVLSGTLRDPYTAMVIVFRRGVGTSTAVQIDHVVALGDAWQKGAQQISPAARLAFANDPLELLAVDGPANEQKGDADAATWLPPNKAYRCQYVARQIAVKARYDLWVTTAENAAMTRVLATCPRQLLPTTGAPVVVVARIMPPTRPGSTLRTTTPKPPSSLPVVHPGAFCSPPGARGVASKGTPMVCKLDSKGLRYRWSHA
jgi:hypothetical protein